MDLTLRVLGVVRSPLDDPATAPRFETENAPPADLVLDPAYRTAARDLAVGQEILVFTWLHKADRSCQEVHPRNNPDRALTGVFTTRSPDRPNPIGLHRVRIKAIGEGRITVGGIEAVDGTPVIDIKPTDESGPRP